MPSDCISYQDSGYFTPIINDYLNREPSLQPLYHRFPTLENFEAQLLEKQQNYNHSFRKILIDTLSKQYKGITVSKATQSNIDSLALENTFTIVTGHQLNLFSGPLYFLYKIISTINLTEQLKAEYPNRNFVPVYWMATEDHDFDEISFFNFNGKKFRWNTESSGPVGRLSTKGLEEVFEVFALELGSGDNADYLKALFTKSYLEHDNLADATRYLANALFADTGLVILDGDCAAFKQVFAPYAKEELLRQTAFAQVNAITPLLKAYGVQVNPREINMFYIEDELRERIILENGVYKIINTKLEFTQAEIVALLEKSPEKFSPNAILRPLYEEVLLPNLCYIGGGGELAYWFELKSLFESVKVTFPILLLRNSVLLVTEKQSKKADKLDLSWHDLFKKPAELRDEKVKRLSEFPIDLSIQKDHLKTQFHYLHLIAEQTDKSFTGAVKAQEAKQIKGLENLEKRLLKAQKRKYTEELERIMALQQELFPNNALQERQVNFGEFYLESGEMLIQRLRAALHPLDDQFNVVVF